MIGENVPLKCPGEPTTALPLRLVRKGPAHRDVIGVSNPMIFQQISHVGQRDNTQPPLGAMGQLGSENHDRRPENDTALAPTPPTRFFFLLPSRRLIPPLPALVQLIRSLPASSCQNTVLPSYEYIFPPFSPLRSSIPLFDSSTPLFSFLFLFVLSIPCFITTTPWLRHTTTPTFNNSSTMAPPVIISNRRITKAAVGGVRGWPRKTASGSSAESRACASWRRPRR